MASLLTLVERFNFTCRIQDIRVSSPISLEGFSWKFFFRISFDPSPACVLVFDVLWRINIPKKIMIFSKQVLLDPVNTLDRLVRKMSLLMVPFCCILCRKVEENPNNIL